MQVSKLAAGRSSSLLRQATGTAPVAVARRAGRVVTAAGSKPKSDHVPVAVAGVVLSTGLGGVTGAAHAATPDVDSAVSSVIDIVKATGEMVKQGLSAAQTGAEYAKQAYDQVAPVVSGAYDAAAPVVASGVKAAEGLAAPALSEVGPTLGKTLSSTGLDTSAAAAGAKAAASAAAPALETALRFLTTTEPLLLGQYALGAVAALYLLPPAAKLALGALRGYAGDVSPAGALDALSSRRDCVLVDIRPAKDKAASGSPELPNNGRLVELEYASIDDRRVRGQLRNAGELEVQVTALQVAALKRLSKGTTLFVFDRSGATARAVARELARRGFGKVFVVAGGFQGWVNARLRVRAPLPVVASRVEVLPAGRVSAAPRLPAPVAPRQLGSPGTARQFGSAAGTGSRTAAKSAAPKAQPAKSSVTTVKADFVLPPRRALPSGTRSQGTASGTRKQQQ